LYIKELKDFSDKINWLTISKNELILTYRKKNLEKRLPDYYKKDKNSMIR